MSSRQVGCLSWSQFSQGLTHCLDRSRHSTHIGLIMTKFWICSQGTSPSGPHLSHSLSYIPIYFFKCSYDHRLKDALEEQKLWTVGIRMPALESERPGPWCCFCPVLTSRTLGFNVLILKMVIIAVPSIKVLLGGLNKADW